LRTLSLIGALMVTALPAVAQAAADRVWVSGHGVDQAGCGAPTAPCRSLQYAHDHAVNAGGEIDILDPAGYGAVEITKSVSIVNDGVGTAGVQTTLGTAINIHAGASDAIYLRGLNIDGVNFAGANGVVLISGGSLTVVNCVVRHFSQNGIYLLPSRGPVQVSISNTLSSENEQAGLQFAPLTGSTAAVNGEVDHLTANGDLDGIQIVSSSDTGAVNFALTDIIASNNGSAGVLLESTAATLKVTIDSADLNLNAADGLAVLGDPTAYISRSVADHNGQYGIFNDAGSGHVFSTGSNLVESNALGNVQGGTTTEGLQ
jgi:hypothetical protein